MGDKIAQSLFFGGQKCPITLIARVNYGKPYIFAGQRKGLWEGDVLLDGLVQVVITLRSSWSSIIICRLVEAAVKNVMISTWTPGELDAPCLKHGTCLDQQLGGVRGDWRTWLILLKNIIIIKIWQILGRRKKQLITILFKNIIFIKNMTDIRWEENMLVTCLPPKYDNYLIIITGWNIWRRTYLNIVTTIKNYKYKMGGEQQECLGQKRTQDVPR